MIGTGAFKLVNYVDKKSAALVRHAAYWGGRPPLDGVKITFYQGTAPMVLALAREPDRPRLPALRPGGTGLQEELEVHVLQPPDIGASAAVHAHRPGRAEGSPRSAGSGALDQSSPADAEDPARGRSGRQRQPVLEELRVDRSVDQAAHPERPARKGATRRGGRPEPEVQHHDVELRRSSGSCGVHPGVREGGRHRRRHRDDGRRQVLRLRARWCGLRDDDAVAEPHVHPHRVRGTWCAEHLPHPGLHVDR